MMNPPNGGASGSVIRAFDRTIIIPQGENQPFEDIQPSLID